MLISQAGGEKKAEEALGQSIKSFRREFWYEMRDRLLSEKYQQQLSRKVQILLQIQLLDLDICFYKKGLLYLGYF